MFGHSKARILLSASSSLVLFLSLPVAAQTQNSTVAPSTASSSADRLTPTGRWTAFSRGAATLPPMGWNSWNAFQLDVNEEKLMAAANAIVQSGLAAKGYRYLNLDDGWWLNRGSDKRMVVRADKFPSARLPDGRTSLRPLTDRLHAMGLKAGIYTDMGRNSCGQIHSEDYANLPSGTVLEREIGLYGNVERDIALYFQEWGFDYIKVDACGLRGLADGSPKVASGEFRALKPTVDSGSVHRSDIDATKALFASVRDALIQFNPDDDFIFSICLWGAANVREWAREVGNISRTSEDIFPIWGRMLHNMDTAIRRPLYAQPGSWNDPDMLYISQGDFDENNLTAARAHLSIWAMLNAPLLIGYDLRAPSPAIMEILGNADVIALNQDPAGHQAVLAYDSTDVNILVKTLANGDKAVAIINRLSTPVSPTLVSTHLKFAEKTDIHLTDLWTGKESVFQDRLKLTLAPRETAIFRVKGIRSFPDGLYLSEMPGRIHPAADGVVVPDHDPLVSRAILPWAHTHFTREGPRYAGWGGAQADATPYSEDISIGREKFVTGIGILANSRMEVRNNAEFRRFTAMVGVDDSARDRSQPVTFEIYGDGRLLAKSSPMRWGEPAAAISADTTGIQIVELVAKTPASVRFPDVVAWGNAALHRN